MNSNISRPHHFDFYLYLPTELAAKQAAEKIRARNFVVEVLPAASGSDWLCKATIKIVPETAPLDDIRIFFEEVVSASNGNFDGWESDVVRM